MKPTGKLKFAYDSIANLEQKISRLEYENDELKSKLDELSMAANEVCVYLNENKFNNIGSGSALHTQLELVLNQTPQQSLNEIRAQAIEGAVYKCFPDSQIYTSQMAGIVATVKSELSEYVANIRNHNEKTTA